uniref:Uncharacterized protein n=3 Tax=Avena sativa TaxID=4498 RepID=A0ACD5TAZ7_AVESA
MRTEVIKADTIDVAAEMILNELGADTRRSGNRENVIYFDGWNGLGACDVLQAIAKRLAVSSELLMRPAGLDFDEIIHIDCSKWESRRAMQRKIAEQLKLPDWVMEMFDKQDEEDDFAGLDQGSRGEIEQVFTEIYQTIHNHKFLLILHNGSNDEIDIFNFGLYLYGYANSKMLWTFRGRFRLDPKVMDNVKKNTTTHVLLSASRDGRDPKELWSYLVRHEAAQLCHGIIDSAVAAECVLYMLKQCCIGSHIIDYDWAIHTTNYWVCNGIIALSDIDRAWKVGDVLQREVHMLNIDSRLTNDEATIMLSSHLVRSAERMPYCISTTTCGFVQSHSGVILENMFERSHGLSVLKLSWCTFSLSLPPFLYCHSLRFLWIEHCQDHITRSSSDHCHIDADKEELELDNSTTRSWPCFQSLWVLDLRYTDCDWILSAQVMDLMTQLRVLNVTGAKNWDMSHLRGRLHNIRKLRITKSTCFFNNDVFSKMESIELLEFSGNTVRQGMSSFSVSASNSSLKTVTIDGCDGLRIISFRGCKELKNVFLKGLLWFIGKLDISGTNIKTLDLGGIQSILPERIILLGCHRLRAILWPERVKDKLNWPCILRIDTTSTSAPMEGVEAPHAHPYCDQSLQKQKEEKFNGGWQISVTDARLLRSLSPVSGYLSDECIHLDICGTTILGGSNVQGTNKDKLVEVQPHKSTVMDSEYRDVLKGGSVGVMMMWDCPEINWWRRATTCIIKVMIMHGQGKKLLEDARGALSFPDFMCIGATSLHVYDNSSIISIPAPLRGLRWCRVERCPKLKEVFTGMWSFYDLYTFWASQLLTACYIWGWPYYLHNLDFLHLDHCPRLVHVLPYYSWNIHPWLTLVTLEILYCSDLKEVVPLDPKLQEQGTIIKCPKLRHIHLHELPTLQRISGLRMSAPTLETIKIRGCWSLRRLPAVGRNTKPPKVDCEKEWWDKLEWDGLEKYHHPSLYEPRHSLYYKAQLPRVSLLR